MKMVTETKRGRHNLAILRLAGRFDAHEEPDVRRWISERLQEGQNQLAINLSEVTFIDSTALSALVSGMKRGREAGGDLLLCGLARPVRIIFELTRLDRVFDIYGSEEEAIEHFSRPETTERGSNAVAMWQG